MATKTIYVCDRCDGTSDTPLDVLSVTFERTRAAAPKLDICPNCRAAIEAFIAGEAPAEAGRVVPMRKAGGAR